MPLGRRRSGSLLAALAALVLLAGCGDPDETYSFVFSNTAAIDIPNAVALRFHDNGQRKVTLAIYVQPFDLAPVSGASFDVIFGSELVEFDRIRPGNWLETGGEVDYSAVPSASQPGLVHVEIAQQPGAEPQLGEGRLALIELKAQDEGTTMIDFANPVLLGPAPETPPLGGVLWFGGLLTIY